jgi:hypothetical protein
VPEFMLKISNSMGLVVCETYISGETADEVLSCAIEEIESAQTSESDWTAGLDEEFA